VIVLVSLAYFRGRVPLIPWCVILSAVFAYAALAVSSPLPIWVGHPSEEPDGVRLRVLTLNMHGLRYPPQLGWMADQSDCADRFRTVGARIRNADPPYDIVAIQELYRVSDLHIITCDATPFLDALERGGGRLSGLRRILFSPKGQTWKLEADGGIGVVTPHSVEESEALRFVGSGGPFLAARGILYARIVLPNSPVGVDTYVVHLSPGRQNASQRRRELEALSKLVAAKSSTSGNPVVVLGDFNIEGPPAVGGEYGTVLRLLGEPRDLALEDARTDPGYTYDCLGNALAAMRRCDYQARIDYVWVVTNRGLSNSDYEVKVSNVRKVEWHTDRPESLPVSDHYGVEAFLLITRKDSASPPRRDPSAD
jgi:endonuclease/exonuclease/phosphatase family metal-dependent hydrolase